MCKNKPKLLCSKCLGFDNCRYNGEVIPSPYVHKLSGFCDIITVCPEVEIGLGVPRKPIRIVQKKQRQRLMQPETMRDVSREMDDFCDSFFNQLEGVHGFLLKYKSPSCGLFSAKYHAGIDNSGTVGSGAGFFGRAVLNRYPGFPAENEKRLTNFAIRDHFLTRLFTFSEFAGVRHKQDAKSLIDFQANNKLLLLAHNQKIMRELGRLVAGQKETGVRKTIARYEKLLMEALKERAPHQSHINVIQHAAGYFSKNITGEEREYINGLLTQYKEKRVPLSAVRSVLKSYIIRFDIDYLKGQTYFEPYPAGLVEVADSGKGRDLKHI